jgi:hypothetical protein
MSKGTVFISSVLDRGKEDLRAERSALAEVVRQYGFLEDWRFEDAPASSEELESSYLNPVESCHVFVLLLGGVLTAPVAKEFAAARQHNRAILVFVKNQESRDAVASAFLKKLPVKYASFRDVDDLKLKFKAALEQEILRQMSERSAGSSVVAKLQVLHGTCCYVNPVIPASRGSDRFRVVEASEESVRLQKESSSQFIDIPTQRISEVLVTSKADPVTLQLNGRLQWLEPSQQWRFFTDAPQTRLEKRHGLSKASSFSDSRVGAVSSLIASRGGRAGFGREDEFAGLLDSGWEIVYDDDGYYFRAAGRDTDQILLVLKTG